MERLVIHSEKIADRRAFLSICPFGALELDEKGEVVINAACRMCRICVKNGPPGAAVMENAADAKAFNAADWNGIAVYAEQEAGKPHPVSLELLGKASELAAVSGERVIVLICGENAGDAAESLRYYGADEIYVYERAELKYFRAEPYAAVFEHFIKGTKPSSVLVGATPYGRQLAPRVAARINTGLTADCTALEMGEKGDLVQIRPAFGGNIMAEITTPRARPQMATVRYKVMNAPKRRETPVGVIKQRRVSDNALVSGVEIIEVKPKPAEMYIEDVDVIVAAGRGVKKQADMNMIKELAALLGGQAACSRPLAEAGFLSANRQIGLSGRTVRPKFILTCGISGSVQFTAGMSKADVIAAINTDSKAPIFRVAHYAIIGDLYQIVPEMIHKLRERKKAVTR
ncbi:MAG: electron transfer flavoprotein subunit alpha [Clostridiales bacterium]|jgi:electron transfer flavoprotein alpha subunit|nr:electron transfer flavoprotein subunit alpha [Clostridiales bacterium]